MEQKISFRRGGTTGLSDELTDLADLDRELTDLATSQRPSLFYKVISYHDQVLCTCFIVLGALSW